VLASGANLQHRPRQTTGFLSSDPNAVGDAIVQGEDCSPSKAGTLVDLNGSDDLNSKLAHVESAGGSVLVPKAEIGNGFGFSCHFLDTEGKRAGLHSMA
jgi:uncharacterized protein